MKKTILSLTVVVLCICTLCACGEKSKTDFYGKDVKSYAEKGILPECEYALGDSVKKVEKGVGLSNKEKDNVSEEENGEPEAYSYESDKYTGIFLGDSSYYYLTEDKDNGICAVCSTGNAYGYVSGTVITVIKSEMEKRGYKADIKTLPEEYEFFMPVRDTYECLEYEFKENKIFFVFYDNGLCVTAIVKK